MSGAACAKKRLCNPPVAAAVETADGLVALLDRYMEGGQLPHDVGDELIYAMAASDERYCAEQKGIAMKVISVLAEHGL